jgi:hypothetical protein
LVQNFAPPSRVAPQELQNAIKFASRPPIFALTAEYIASLTATALFFFASSALPQRTLRLKSF